MITGLQRKLHSYFKENAQTHAKKIDYTRAKKINLLQVQSQPIHLLCVCVV